MKKAESDKSPPSFALGSFHRAVSEGDIKKVKEYVQGTSSVPGAPGIKIPSNQKDEVSFK